MFNTIILWHGETRLHNDRERKEYWEGKSIYGDNADPVELGRWSIDDEDDAREELERYRCTYDEESAEEYALEYCETDEDGEFLSGSDYDLAKRKYTKMDIAKYIIESMGMMYEDGEYFAHWSEENGLNYDGNTDPENITVSAPCDYADSMSREEFDSKERLSDPDFMRICEKLSDKLNEETEDL